MLEFLRTPVAQAVLWCTVLVALVAFGAYVVSKFRGHAVGSAPVSSDLLSSFREMTQQGDLTEAEFRTIKTQLGATLQNQITDAGHKGCDERK